MATEYNQSLISKFEDFEKDLNSLKDKFMQRNSLLAPEDGKWTFNHILEHLILVEKRMMMIIRLTKKEDSIIHHEPRLVSDEKFHSALIANMDINKLEAPEMVLPKGDLTDIEKGFEDLARNRKEIIQILSDMDTDLEHQVFPHPRMGNMTKSDWIMFNLHHSKRHFIQMERMLA